MLYANGALNQLLTVSLTFVQPPPQRVSNALFSNTKSASISTSVTIIFVTSQKCLIVTLWSDARKSSVALAFEVSAKIFFTLFLVSGYWDSYGVAYSTLPQDTF